MEDVLHSLGFPLRMVVSHQWIGRAKAVFERWVTRPWRYSCLLMLVAAMALGGPLACLVHCLSVPGQQHQHQHGIAHIHTTAEAGHGHEQPSYTPGFSPAVPDPCIELAQNLPLKLHEEPTALTIAIVAALAFLLLLTPTPSRLHLDVVHARSVTRPPPLRPPIVATP